MSTHRLLRVILWPACVVPAVLLCSCNGQPADPTAWRPLFDGKTLKGWKVPKFGGDGKVYVKDGVIHIERGDMCTGITYIDGNSLPRENYEVAVEAMRVSDNDFFAAVTFPVGKDYMSFVPGGWGGAITGLSCIDWMDASENQTTRMITYKNGKWYRFRIRVTKTHIFAWVDDKVIIAVGREDRKISVRAEVELSRPLGIATWCTHGAVSNIRIRQLTKEEGEEVPEEQEY